MRVRVEGLNHDVMDEDIKELFSGVGELLHCAVRLWMSAFLVAYLLCFWLSSEKWAVSCETTTLDLKAHKVLRLRRETQFKTLLYI